MFKREKGERVAIYKQADCLGASCEFYSGQDCESRLELLDATGKSRGGDKGPYIKDCSYALYGRVCMGGEEQVVVGFSSTSPNGKGSMAEMIGRSGIFEHQTIILNTPLSEIKF